jgi:hypothetical protein
MRIYTIENGVVKNGAKIEKMVLQGAGVEIPAIIIGEDGRGRQRGVLPVGGVSAGQDGSYGRLLMATVGTSKAGKPKLWAEETTDSTDKSKAIVVFRTQIGFRGGNSHTGDKYLVPCTRRGKHVAGYYRCPECETGLVPVDETGKSDTFWAGVTHPDEGSTQHWHPFPGEILVQGMIAQGDAGRAGSGSQLIAVIPRGIVFRTGYSGRLYGGPAAHYYVFNGENILACTWAERTATDLF